MTIWPSVRGSSKGKRRRGGVCAPPQHGDRIYQITPADQQSAYGRSMLVDERPQAKVIPQHEERATLRAVQPPAIQNGRKRTGRIALDQVPALSNHQHTEAPEPFTKTPRA